MKLPKDFWVGGPMSDEDSVDHPEHYNQGNIEVIDVIEDWNLGFHCGNAIKYISRHRYKQKPLEDIKKAIWYMERYLAIIEG